MKLEITIILQLHELEEIQNEALDNSLIYKAKTKAYHGKLLLRKTFEVGQKVLMYNTKLHSFLASLKVND